MTLPVSIIIASHGRGALLAQFLPSYIRQNCAEIIIIDDEKSEPIDSDLIEKFNADSTTTIRVIRNASAQGIQRNRMIGVRSSCQPYVLMGHDDVYLADNHIMNLLHYAEDKDIDIVASTWLTTGEMNLQSTHEYPYPIKRVQRVEEVLSYFTFYFYGGTLPTQVIYTPWLHDVALLRRTIFDTVAYDELYAGNSYRCETDFYLSARRAGCSMAFVPGPPAFHYKGKQNVGGGTYSYQGLRRYAWYYFWFTVNTYRFLVKNRDQLIDLGHKRWPSFHVFLLLLKLPEEWIGRWRGIIQ